MHGVVGVGRGACLVSMIYRESCCSECSWWELENKMKSINHLVKKEGDCLRWKGNHFKQGYGRLQREGKIQSAHRYVWKKINGDIPGHLVIDHLCRVRDCVNINHMELVSQTENILRGIAPPSLNAKKKECCNGHLFSGYNLILMKNGRRACRKCGRIRWNAYRKREIEKGTWVPNKWRNKKNAINPI